MHAPGENLPFLLEVALVCLIHVLVWRELGKSVEPCYLSAERAVAGHQDPELEPKDVVVRWRNHLVFVLEEHRPDCLVADESSSPEWREHSAVGH